LGVMFASQIFQQLVVPGLHAQADPVNAEFEQKRCLSRRNASGVRFDRPFLQVGQIELLLKSTQK
jgi:hypothetical protein